MMSSTGMKINGIPNKCLSKISAAVSLQGGFRAP